MTALKTTKAFTLIELLIVIAIIGILAIAILAALNPVEQINRSRDTASIGDAQQLASASERFYTSNEYYPWVPGPQPDQSVNFTMVTAAAPTGGTPAQPMVDLLTTETAELRSSFVERITSGNTEFYVHRDNTATANVYVCFSPVSQEQQTNAAERCSSSPADYPSSACGNTTNCGTAGNCVCVP